MPKMRLTFLGTGDAFETGLGNNSAILEFGGTNLVIDFPANNHVALKQLGIGLQEVENVFISHTHEDHINGLQRLAYYQQVYYQKMQKVDKKPNLYVHPDVYRELDQALVGLKKTVSGHKKLEDYFNVNMVTESFAINEQKFDLVRTMHVPEMPSFGLLIENFAYFSCDSTLNEAWLNLIKDKVKYIFHDAHLFDFEISAHASYQDLKKLPDDIRTKLILMHYDDRYNEEKERILFQEQHNLKLASPFEKYE